MTSAVSVLLPPQHRSCTPVRRPDSYFSQAPREATMPTASASARRTAGRCIRSVADLREIETLASPGRQRAARSVLGVSVGRRLGPRAWRLAPSRPIAAIPLSGRADAAVPRSASRAARRGAGTRSIVCEPRGLARPRTERGQLSSLARSSSAPSVVGELRCAESSP